MPEDHENQIIEFHRFISAIKESNYETEQIGNMDEVPLTLEWYQIGQ